MVGKWDPKKKIFGLNLCQAKSGGVAFWVWGPEKIVQSKFVSSQMWCHLIFREGGGVLGQKIKVA